MATWKELHRFKRLDRKQEQIVAKFIKKWTQGGLFCKNLGRLQWQIVLNSYYLPQHMANHRSRLLMGENTLRSLSFGRSKSFFKILF